MKFLSRLLSFVLVCILGVFLAFLGILYHFGKGLPNYHELSHYEPPVISRIYANDGRLFGEFAHEQRVFLPIEAIPDRLKQAFIAAEDQNFYKHVGVDALAILRSAFRNVSRILSKRRPIGGSTITQQVARNFLLPDTAHKVSLDRKVKEAILALRIEHAFTKDHIFELYLNDIYLGHRSYGVAAAALNYFNKSLNELTIGEAAFLAGLPKAPSRYNPKTHNALAVERRNYVISRMKDEKYITAHEANQAIREPLEIASYYRGRSNIVSAPYFADEVRRILVEKYGEPALYQQGLTIRTTLDARLQNIAHEVLREGLIAYDRRHGWRGPLTRITWQNSASGQPAWLQPLQQVMPPAGIYKWRLAVVVALADTHAVIGFSDRQKGTLPLAELKWARLYRSANARGPAVQKPGDVLSVGDVILVDKKTPAEGQDAQYQLCQIPQVSGALVAMDPFTGRVKAMQGGFNYDLSQYNRATQAMRQPGSSFKPFAYLAALESGLNPSTIIDDAPIAIPLGHGLGVWKPQNVDNKFLGPMTLRRAFEGSRNTVTIRMIQETVGMGRVVDVAKRFGLHDNLPLQYAMLLGAGETTVLKQAAAYAMIANGGKKIDPILIDRIQNRKGKTIYASDPRKCIGCMQGDWTNQPAPEVSDPRPAVTTPEVAYQMTYLLHGAAKHGTGKVVSELRKRPYAGKTGTTNAFRDAWYAGFSPDLVVVVYVGYDDPRTLGDKEFGSSVAAPVFAAFMERALADKPATPFRVPPGIKHVRVDYKTGKKARSGDEEVIVEAFSRNTEVPGADYESEGLASGQTQTSVVGTGQLY